MGGNERERMYDDDDATRGGELEVSPRARERERRRGHRPDRDLATAALLSRERKRERANTRSCTYIDTHTHARTHACLRTARRVVDGTSELTPLLSHVCITHAGILSDQGCG